MTPEEWTYLTVLLFSIPIGFVFKKGGHRMKQFGGAAVGLLLTLVTCNIHTLHSLVTILGTWVILSLSPRSCHYLTLGWTFSYLLFFRMVTFFGLPAPTPFTNAVQLLLTLKMVSLANEVQEISQAKKQDVTSFTKGPALGLIPSVPGLGPTLCYGYLNIRCLQYNPIERGLVSYFTYLMDLLSGTPQGLRRLGFLPGARHRGSHETQQPPLRAAGHQPGAAGTGLGAAGGLSALHSDHGRQPAGAAGLRAAGAPGEIPAQPGDPAHPAQDRVPASLQPPRSPLLPLDPDHLPRGPRRRFLQDLPLQSPAAPVLGDERGAGDVQAAGVRPARGAAGAAAGGVPPEAAGDPRPRPLARLLGQQEFLVPPNVLDLVYGQTVCWVGTAFSPLLPLLHAAKFVLLFYLKKLTLFSNCRPADRTFRPSSSSFFFLLVLLLGLAIAWVPLLYSVFVLQPSQACGPFRGEPTMWSTLWAAIDTLPLVAREFLQFVGSLAFAVPLFLLLCILMFYLMALDHSYSCLVKELKGQLRLEGQDKVFLVTQITELS
ncbi:uncharacterized protein LOC141976888 [Natator depressus]|uniref:uncharacterized protein LOC141976888 n=1 Tax=Natator depressus TaxID=27790 RepID=UPI003EB9E1E9